MFYLKLSVSYVLKLSPSLNMPLEYDTQRCSFKVRHCV